ncbi:DsbA family oxidoreductase [Aeromicrobium sp. CF3.5]|uniref:DsbA family oxidoreductase n=1 Tax=Aeromicrobium sp. CF3.5 TaxID=3373078 RepID=UPI003EE606DC
MKAVVFCDITDPWSYLGATRFERAAATYTILTGEQLEITYRAAVTAQSVDDAEAVAAARISGIELNLEDRVPADTADAWRLVTWAAESGDATQRDLMHQLWRAHFLEGADIADHLVLASRAALVGLDLQTAEALLASTELGEQVQRQRETADGLGAATLPFVVIDGDRTLSGLMSQDDYVQVLGGLYRARDDQ